MTRSGAPMTAGTIASLTGLALALAGGVAFAQQAPPQRTTATYGDWTMRCEMQPGPPPVKQCEMVQSATAQGQPNPISQVAIGRATKTEPFHVVIQLPINVWIPAGVHFVYDPKVQGITAAFKRCVPIGCFADFDMTDDLLKKLRALTAQGYELRMRASAWSRSRSRSTASAAYDALPAE